MQTGNILAEGGALRMLGEKASTPLPFDVVHSGKTTTVWPAFSFIREASVTNLAPWGASCGIESARSMAWKREMRSTSDVFGYEAVNIGLNITARYKQSIGDVNDEAMIEPEDGNLS
jgi:hypothetical protein